LAEIESYAKKPARPGRPTYILANNQLAGAYLVQVLARNRLVRPILCHQLPKPRLRSLPTVFVLEGSFIPLPLGECIRRLRSCFPKARVIVVNKPQPDAEIIRLMTLGASGFVEHANVTTTLANAVRRVATGGLWIADNLLQRYVNLTTEARRRGRGGTLMSTPREAEVLELVRQRLSNKEIAKVLGVRESTVKYHLSHILRKFCVEGRRSLDIRANSARVWEELRR
jgi:DNA-binding NarL/FixJ family response regulator